MKRSDAEYIIGCRLDGMSVMEISPHEILIIVQELGMLPPPTGKLVTNYADMGTMPEYDWEPEDGE